MKLEVVRGNWVEEFPGLLWAYRTTTRAPTGETPFRMVYDMEVIIPAEVVLESARVQVYDPTNNEA